MDLVRIPLFPLNTVLFPRMPLPLHVFEERYKKLIDRCVESQEVFGVVLATDPEERGGETARVGTLARIHALQRLDGGRMNLLAFGGERFAVLDRARCEDDYYLAAGEPITDVPAPSGSLDPLVSEAVRLFGVYFKVLVSKVGMEIPEYELPDDPSDLSFVVASVIDLSTTRRQEFLELTSTAERLQQEIALLQSGIRRLTSSANVASRFELDKAKAAFSRN